MRNGAGICCTRLNRLRANLRNRFNKTNLETSFDKRYTLKVAHSTIVRFKKKVHHKEAFINLLQKYRHHAFGTCEINEVELVYNDWYLRKEKVEVLARFKLNPPGQETRK
jgi:2'-5' RNA ligase